MAGQRVKIFIGKYLMGNGLRKYVYTLEDMLIRFNFLLMLDNSHRNLEEMEVLSTGLKIKGRDSQVSK